MPDTRSQEAGETRPKEDMLTVTGLLNVLLRQRWLIGWTAVTGAVLAILVSMILAAYVARASFTPAGQASGMRGLAQVAQTFGVDVGAASGTGPTLDFYVSVLQSRQLLSQVVRSRFKSPTSAGSPGTASTTLLDVYGFHGDTSRRALLKAVDRFRRDLDVSSNPAANLVSFSVRAKDPDLAESIGRRLLDLVNEFNIHQLQFNAATERRFVQDRSEQARRQLRLSEDSLRTFLERNRSVDESPRLQFELQRMQRAIALRQQLYTTLAQSLEQARIAEVRDTPVITIVDAPEGSALRARHALRNGIMGLLVGLVLGIVLGFGRENFWMEREQHPEEHEEFTRLRKHVFSRTIPTRRD